MRCGRGQGERFGTPGMKISVVIPVCIYLIECRKSLPLSHPYSAYSELWPCPEWTPDGSCRCSEHKRFLVCRRVYQCLNRTGGSAGTPYQQLIGTHSFPCTFASHLNLPSPISAELKIARPGCVTRKRKSQLPSIVVCVGSWDLICILPM